MVEIDYKNKFLSISY